MDKGQKKIHIRAVLNNNKSLQILNKLYDYIHICYSNYIQIKTILKTQKVNSGVFFLRVRSFSHL